VKTAFGNSIVYGFFTLVAIVSFVVTYGIWRGTTDLTRRTCLSSATGGFLNGLHAPPEGFDLSPRKLSQKDFASLTGSDFYKNDCCGLVNGYIEFHFVIGEGSSTERPNVKVWGNGADGVSGTEDDLVLIPGD